MTVRNENDCKEQGMTVRNESRHKFSETYAYEIVVPKLSSMWNISCDYGFSIPVITRKYWIRLVSGREFEWTEVCGIRHGLDGCGRIGRVDRVGCCDLRYPGDLVLILGDEKIRGKWIESFRLISEEKHWVNYDYCFLKGRWPWSSRVSWFVEVVAG